MISVVVPVWNEETALPATLRALLAQEGDYEVIAVDGGSTDRTLEILAGYGFRRPSPLTADSSRTVLVAPKGRASQMNVGAKAARGDWLMFLHADTLLPEGALTRLNRLEADVTVQAGGFLHRFSGDDWRLRFISFLDNFRCTRSRTIYGDQALFVRRSLFEQLGGFPQLPFLEDVRFCDRLTRVTRPLLLSPPVVTDARKFVKMGIWRSFVRVLCIILHVEFRFPYCPKVFFQDVR